MGTEETDSEKQKSTHKKESIRSALIGGCIVLILNVVIYATERGMVLKQVEIDTKRLDVMEQTTIPNIKSEIAVVRDTLTNHIKTQNYEKGTLDASLHQLTEDMGWVKKILWKIAQQKNIDLGDLDTSRHRKTQVTDTAMKSNP